MTVAIVIGISLSLLAVVVFVYLRTTNRRASSSASAYEVAGARQARQTASTVAPTRPAAPPATKPAALPDPVYKTEAHMLAALRLRLINCFGGNQAVMERNITFELRKHPQLSEKEVLEKMLYDLARRR